MRLKRGVREFRILNRKHKLLHLYGVGGGNGKRAPVPGTWVETKHGARYDAQRAERAGYELRKIIPRHVFYDFAAAAGEGSVRKRNRDSDNQIAQRAKTQTQCAAVTAG